MHKLDTRLLLHYELPVDPYSFPALSKQPSPRGSNWKNGGVHSVWLLTRERHLSDLKLQVKIVYRLQLSAVSAFIELALQNSRAQVDSLLCPFLVCFHLKHDHFCLLIDLEGCLVRQERLFLYLISLPTIKTTKKST